MTLLKQLRALTPTRPLTFEEARWVAERQAERLRQLTDCADERFLPRDVIEAQPKLAVLIDDDLPHSGASHWTGSSWQITIRGTEPFARQRYTLAHEYKHILDFPFDHFRSPGPGDYQRAEHLCDYFAACLLMPKVLVRRAWTSGGDNQDVVELGRLFGVSPKAMEIRLQQLGLLDARYRCAHRSGLPGRTRYFRSLAHAYEPALPVGRVAALSGGA